jgi:hypothetical protein
MRDALSELANVRFPTIADIRAVSAFDPKRTLEIRRPGLSPTRFQLLLSRLPPFNKGAYIFGKPLRFQLPLIEREKRHKRRVRSPWMRRNALLRPHLLKLPQHLLKRGASPSVDPIHRGRVCRNALAVASAPAPIGLVTIALNQPNGWPSEIERGEHDGFFNLDTETAAVLSQDKSLRWMLIGW